MTAIDPYDDEDLDARADIGYAGSREAEPDLDELADVAPTSPASARTGPTTAPAMPNLPGAVGNCRRCPAEKVLLFSTLSSPTPIICGRCQGNDNRGLTENIRDTIRSLKAAAACGNHSEERTLMAQLGGFVGKHQAEQTVAAIRQSLESGKGGGRGKGAPY